MVTGHFFSFSNPLYSLRFGHLRICFIFATYCDVVISTLPRLTFCLSRTFRLRLCSSMSIYQPICASCDSHSTSLGSNRALVCMPLVAWWGPCPLWSPSPGLTHHPCQSALPFCAARTVYVISHSVTSSDSMRQNRVVMI